MTGLEEITLPDGSTRRLGNVIPPDGLTGVWQVYGSVPNTPMVPRAVWKDAIDAMGTGPEVAWQLPYIHDQDGVGMCNCSATASAMESTRLKQGLPVRKLSAGDLYRRICFNCRDSGSLLEDGIRVAMAEGLATINTVPYMDWHNDHPGAAEERQANRVLEAFLCPTFDHHMSAALSGFDLISGIMWYDSYRPTAQTGFWLPAASGSAGGHAIPGYKPTRRGDEFGIWHRNSWTETFADRGRFVIAERQYAGKVGGWWAVRAVTDEGGVVPTPSN